jgi:very-short-patch-repair endonuclease
MKSKIIFNRKSLKSFRSSLRNRSTSAEAALWEMLKSRKLEGRKFRGQYSIGSYIVDFCCPAEKLVIELDGAPHGEYHHPGRNHPLQYLGYHCAAATPPSKGGENIMNEQNFDIPIRLSLLILPVKSSSGSLS